MFLEGQDDALLHYDGGEFYQWLRDCEAGMHLVLGYWGRCRHSCMHPAARAATYWH